ncbi:MAG TPA: MotA/TolQ/ExbB proton channel family protein, partial [Nannocystaceae bacterium]|nr:MotA/TolQ/ExbB proton channel family protein [Nannocystaceae bacterium]
VVDLSFEEIARLMAGDRVESAARTLVELQRKTSWIERFAQYSVHLGILGTVFALVSSDPTDLDSFRAGLPMALGTTFWGLVGALALSAIAGACESVFDRARQHVREALLEGLEARSDAP